MPTRLHVRLVRRSFPYALLAVLVAPFFLTAPRADGPSYSIAHQFQGLDGRNPQGGLTLGSDGRLYGATCEGGTGFGTLFTFEPPNALATIHSFSGGPDGACPTGSLLRVGDVLYGTTADQSATGGPSGTVYRFSSGGFQTVHSFTGAPLDGADPRGLTAGADGLVYGVTARGGLDNLGTAFRIEADDSLTIIHHFQASEGYAPAGRLILATDGFFYGTARQGPDVDDGSGGTVALGGTVFRIDAFGNVTTLAGFASAHPTSLVQASNGMFYGTTEHGGALASGTVFRTLGDGNVETVHEFSGADGLSPIAALVETPDGTLYGTTQFGGSYSNGTVFRIEANGSLTVVHSFGSISDDGAEPIGSLALGPDALLYGTASSGGVLGHGVVFSATPAHSTTLVVANVSGTYGGVVTLSATLTSGVDPIAGRTVTFRLQGQLVGSGVTDVNGLVSLAGVALAGIDAGTYTGAVEAGFAGDDVYAASTGAADLQLSKAVPVITWADPPPITVGTPLGAEQLNAAVDVPGTLTYDPVAGVVLPAGTHTLSAAFTPADATNYTAAAKAVLLSVQRLTPTVTWTAPASITFGTALGATQLNATASVPGTFAYSPAAGTVLPVGLQSLSTTFTPTDSANYTQQTAVVPITVAPATPSVQLTLGATSVAAGQPLTLTATVAGSGATPTGSVAFKDGATTIGSAALNASGQAVLTTAALTVGSHALTAAYGGDANFTSSASVAASVAVLVSVTTYHNDLNRTGANVSETVLNTANVNVATFGKLFSRAVDGQIYAQPLYVSAVDLPGQGVHNVVYVATEHNTVYAFEADDALVSAPFWQTSLGPAIASSTLGVNSDLVPEIGVTGTPAIDLTTGTLYVVAETFESGNALFRLHALDIRTGAEKFGGPVLIQGNVPGTGDASDNGVVPFQPFYHWQRPGLALANGNVYITFGSHGDTRPYHGWLFAYNTATLQQTGILCLSPDAEAGAIWHTAAPAIDASGNIFVTTGNGTMNADSGGQSYGSSVVKVAAGGLAVADYFSPSNQAALSAADSDFGSQGPLLIPGASRIVAGGKEGKLFVLDTANLGQFHTTDQVVQEWSAGHALFGGNVYYNSTLYTWGRGDPLNAYAFNGTTFNTTPISASTFNVPFGFLNQPAMSLSANGTTPGTGILWAAYSINGQANGGAFPGILRAFDASDLTRELWNSGQNPARDAAGSWGKWAPPTIANGKVYLGTFDNKLNVFGLAPPTVTMTQPTDGAIVMGPTSILISATAAAPAGIDRVEFYNESTLIGTATASPYQFTWNNVSAGTYTLFARMYSPQGVTLDSGAITIRVIDDTNVALASRGAVATASSTVNSGFPASAVINGDRKGLNWGSGGGWNDGTPNVYPDWVQVDFNAAYTINRIDVVSLQDTFEAPVEPTSTMAFTLYGLRDFDAQYWDGAAWQTVPGGHIVGNTNVWRSVVFPAVTTTKIRVFITSGGGGSSRMVELEAHTAAAGGNTPPTVSVTSPANGATQVAPASFLVTANPADSDGIEHVDFFYQASGGPVTQIGAAVTSPPYQVNWTGVAAGSYTLTARAFDALGASTTSAGVSVTVTPPGNTPPTVSVTSPANGATQTAPASFLVTANPADSNGIEHVDFFYQASGGPVTQIGAAVTSPPYQVNWTGVAAGSYTLTAKAFDTLGASTTSAGVSVTVTAAGRTNVAAASQGATASASSTVSSGYPASSVINGDRKGLNWGSGGGWNDATAGAFPDWVQVDFSGTRTIDEVDVFTLQDNYGSPIEPTAGLTFSNYGVRDFDVQYWDGAAWQTVAGGHIVGNTNVWRTVAFAAVTTAKIRVLVTNGLGGYSRLVEVEAYQVSGGPGTPPTVSVTSPANGATQVAPASFLVTANPADSDGIEHVDFFYQASGGPVTQIGAAVTSPPYQVNWTGVAAGSYTLTAKAFDTLGASTTSAGVSVTVTPPGNTPPTVSVTSPANGATQVAPASFLVTANPADSDGIEHVDFFYQASGGPVTQIGAAVTSPPYQVNWTNVAAGSYTLTAKAFDTLGASTTSAGVSVTVTAAGRTNVAAASQGATASASSTFSASFVASAVINGDRKGLNWGSGGGWNDATGGAFPDWVQVDFGGTRTIDEIDVFTLQDNYGAPIEPTAGLTFSNYGVRDFDVQYWDGAAWQTVPGGHIVGNTNVWRTVAFAAVTTAKIRVLVTNGSGGYSRLVEVEAYAVSGGPGTPPTVTLTNPAEGATQTAPASFLVTANPSDSDGIEHVDFFYQASGGPVTQISSAVTSPPYQVNWTGVAVGSYTLTATAFDTLGASATSAPVHVTVTPVGANTPPTVSVTSPANGATQTAPASFLVTANPMDSDGIEHVEFSYQSSGGPVTQIGPNVTSPPYQVNWTNVAAGSYTLTAKAFDTLGASTTSAAVSVTVTAAGRTNVAAASQGATASASSTFSASFAAGAVINGDRKGLNWGSGGGWNDATPTSYPDWVQVDFSGARTIDEIDVFTLQDNYGSPIEPTAGLTFGNYGVRDFDVQYWDGAAWQTVTGGHIVGNTNVWRTVAFAPVTTAKIRVLVTNGSGGYSRLVEVEAYAVSGGPGTPPTVTLTNPAEGATQTAPASFLVTANPIDVDGIEHVDFFYQASGGPVTQISSAVTSSPYQVNWTGVAAGTYTLTATAFDVLGASATSAPVHVTVTAAGNAPPTVIVTSPANGATQTVPAAFLLTANANDSDGIEHVEFFYQASGGPLTQIGPNVTSYPYQVNWTIGTAGSYTLTAKAFDTLGASTTSAGVSVTVTAAVRTNVAAASQGATASASSTFSASFAASAVINGDRKGLNWGSGGGWNDGTAAGYPDWVQVDFSGARTIDEIDVFTLQDNYGSPIEPTAGLTFSNYGVRDFDVQYWDGAAWQTVTGGHIVGNTNVWRTVAFAAVTTPKIRVQVTNGSGGYSRLVEVEAYAVSGGPGTPPTVTLTSPTAAATQETPATWTVTASPSDVDGIEHVDFFYQASGGPVTQIGAAVTSPPYTVTWTNVAAGTYVLTATAYDTYGASATSAPVPVEVTAAGANTPPTVSLTSPPNGTTQSASLPLALTAAASDGNGIDRVEFYYLTSMTGVTQIGQAVTTAPYTVTWSDAAPGTYSLTARAFDLLGASTTSAPIQVTLTPAGTRTNVAAASQGATASASSTVNSGYPASAVINGDRKGLNWGSGGGWNDATLGAFPDWVQVDFSGARTIDEIDVFTLQDNYGSPIEPTAGMTFANYGVRNFDVQYWDGAAWQTVPGGHIVGNTNVWRTVAFAAVTTTRIRIFVNTAGGGHSRIVEVEAYETSP